MPCHAHHEPQPQPPPCCSCCSGCAGAPPPPPCYYPAPSSSAASDHLLHAIAAHLLLSSPAPTPPTPTVPPPHPQPQPSPPAAHYVTNPHPYPYQYQYQYRHRHQHQQQEQAYTHPPRPEPLQPQHNTASDHGHLLLHSLLRRVAALECALPGGFPSTPPARQPPHPIPRSRRAARYQEEEEEEEDGEERSEPPPPPPRPRQPARPGASSAVELAARTIQFHFRRFLARRSRTLRQLKELAVLRSEAAAIRGSLSGRCRGATDPSSVSEAAMILLLRLDAIEGGDPMIREGRRALSRELTRILEFVEKVLVKKHEQMAEGDALDSDEYHEGFDAAVVANRPAVNKKKVSFSGNGHVHERNGETENGHDVDEASESSSSAESDEGKGVPGKRSANGKAGLAAPVPVHMESRKISGERR